MRESNLRHFRFLYLFIALSRAKRRTSRETNLIAGIKIMTSPTFDSVKGSVPFLTVNAIRSNQAFRNKLHLNIKWLKLQLNVIDLSTDLSVSTHFCSVSIR